MLRYVDLFYSFHYVYITFLVHHWWIFKFFPAFHYFLPGCSKDSCPSPFVHKQQFLWEIYSVAESMGLVHAWFLFYLGSAKRLWKRPLIYIYFHQQKVVWTNTYWTIHNIIGHNKKSHIHSSKPKIKNKSKTKHKPKGYKKWIKNKK